MQTASLLTDESGGDPSATLFDKTEIAKIFDNTLFWARSHESSSEILS